MHAKEPELIEWRRENATVQRCIPGWWLWTASTWLNWNYTSQNPLPRSPKRENQPLAKREKLEGESEKADFPLWSASPRGSENRCKCVGGFQLVLILPEPPQISSFLSSAGQTLSGKWQACLGAGESSSGPCLIPRKPPYSVILAVVLLPWLNPGLTPSGKTSSGQTFYEKLLDKKEKVKELR